MIIIELYSNMFYDNPYNYLYGYLTKEYGYNESEEIFMNKINKILFSKDLNLEDHKELFSNDKIYTELINILITIKVNENDRCFVEQNNSY